MVQSAIEHGLTVLGFSGHCMYPLDPEFYRPVDNVWHMQLASIDAYAAEIRRLAQKYEGQIKILLGFEADYFCSARYGEAVPDKTAYGKFAPDYLIGSVHFINASDQEFGFYTVDNKAECVGEVTRPDRLCHEHSFLLCEIQYLLCLESIGHERFLDKTSLAFSDGFHRHVKMVRVRGGDIYKVHFRVVKKLIFYLIC